MDVCIKLSEDMAQYKSYITDEVMYYVPGNVFWKTRDGKFLGCNLNVAKVLGLKSPEDIIGKTNEDLFDKTLAKKASATDEIVYSTGQTYVTEEPGLNIHGKRAIYYSEKKPLRDNSGQVIGLVGISIDITERKNFEVQLESAKDKAESASKAKSEFLANLSHDLRTPLSSLVAINKYIVSQTEHQEINAIAADAQVCAEQVMYLIDEVLEIAEIDAGHVRNKVQICQLRELLQSIIKLMLPAAKQKSLKLHVKYDESIPEFIATQCHLIHRILMNLVSNAIKFTHEGEVVISAKLLEKREDNFTLQLSVSDTGIGMAEEHHERIFEQFERLTRAYEGNYQGRGLGLYIVKQFARLLEADIEIDSSENLGTTIQLIIPLKIAHQEQLASKPLEFIAKHEPFAKKKKLTSSNITVSNSVQSNRKILLVEDTQIAQVVAKIALKPYVSHIDVAHNGQMAIDFVEQGQRYDLIFLDIGLPDMSGLDVAKAIRVFERERDQAPMPIVALTAHLSMKHSQEVLSAGIQQVMFKPITLQKAETVLKNWFLNISSRQSLGLSPQQISDEHHQTHTSNSPIELALAEKLVGDKDLAKSMLADFVKSLPESARAIKDAFNQKNKEALKDAAHYLNGGSSYAGVPLLKRACNSLEAAINDEFSDEEITELYHDICTEIDNVLKAYDDGAY